MWGCFVPTTPPMFLQLLQTSALIPVQPCQRKARSLQNDWWKGMFWTKHPYNVPSTPPDSALIPMQLCQRQLRSLQKAWWNGNKDLQGCSNSQNQQLHRSVGTTWNNWKRLKASYSMQLHIPSLTLVSFCLVSWFTSSCMENSWKSPCLSWCHWDIWSNCTIVTCLHAWRNVKATEWCLIVHIVNGLRQRPIFFFAFLEALLKDGISMREMGVMYHDFNNA